MAQHMRGVFSVNSVAEPFLCKPLLRWKEDVSNCFSHLDSKGALRSSPPAMLARVSAACRDLVSLHAAAFSPQRWAL